VEQHDWHGQLLYANHLFLILLNSNDCSYFVIMIFHCFHVVVFLCGHSLLFFSFCCHTYAVMCCLSVCLSVTLLYSVEMSKYIFKIFLMSVSLTILVFLYQTSWQYSDRDP